MKKNYYVFLMFLMLGNLSNVFALPTYSSKLDHSMIQMIKNNAVESPAKISDLYLRYADIEQSRIGRDYVMKNHNEMQTNPIYAKTNIFSKSINPDNRLISFQRISYQTIFSNKTHNVSGLIIFPADKKPKGVILYFHPTVFNKISVPSIKFDDTKSDMLAAVYAANGYIVVVPDYIGLGDDFINEHPYILYPILNAEDGRSILQHSLGIFKDRNIGLDYKNIPLYVSGFSEGALYAVWFSRLYQQDKNFYKSLNSLGYKLKQTVATSGPYDVSHVMIPFLLANQINQESNEYNINSTMWGTLLKPALFANTMLTYAAYEGIKPETVFNKRFFNLECTNGYPICFHFDKQYSYSINTVRMINLNQMIMALNYFFSALGISNKYGEMYGLFNNGVTALLSTRDYHDPVMKVAESADATHWKSMNPLTLISLSNDSVVPSLNSENAYNGMVKSGSLNLKYIKVNSSSLKSRAFVGPDEIDHVNFEIYSMFITLQEFMGHK
ncbi:MAG: hypothetical protein PHC75_03810 [Burkholderiales bacterium]|nr:hypothetical protein [Burkholderiales bacterium]